MKEETIFLSARVEAGKSRRDASGCRICEQFSGRNCTHTTSEARVDSCPFRTTRGYDFLRQLEKPCLARLPCSPHSEVRACALVVLTGPSSAFRLDEDPIVRRRPAGRSSTADVCCRLPPACAYLHHWAWASSRISRRAELLTRRRGLTAIRRTACPACCLGAPRLREVCRCWS
jgi:hypothetical protein